MVPLVFHQPSAPESEASFLLGWEFVGSLGSHFIREAIGLAHPRIRNKGMHKAGCRPAGRFGEGLLIIFIHGGTRALISFAALGVEDDLCSISSGVIWLEMVYICIYYIYMCKVPLSRSHIDCPRHGACLDPPTQVLVSGFGT